MRRSGAPAFALPVLALLVSWSGAAPAQSTPSAPRSGSSYMSAELRAMQSDDFANPGMLWVERGAKLWSTRIGPPGSGAAGKSCADCHGDARVSMKGVAARHPAIVRTGEKGGGRLMDVEGRINQCRGERQGAPALAYESEELLALTAYVSHQSRGLPLSVATDGPAAAHFERGRRLHERRIGQMNLACMHCHTDNAGKRLLAETLSEGHPNAYPAYRLEWQGAGSLQRRLRACYAGVRAEPPAFNSDDLLDLSLYLAGRARGLPVETPGVRR